MYVAILTPLLLCLSSCANEPVIKIETHTIIPPPSLLISCPEPMLHGNTYTAITEYAVLLKRDLRICAGRLQGVIDYTEAVQREKSE
ncbi:Rz1-like lysis system protein LysC [Testudinibacter sp. TR-2022]